MTSINWFSLSVAAALLICAMASPLPDTEGKKAYEDAPAEAAMFTDLIDETRKIAIVIKLVRDKNLFEDVPAGKMHYLNDLREQSANVIDCFRIEGNMKVLRCVRKEIEVTFLYLLNTINAIALGEPAVDLVEDSTMPSPDFQ